MLIPILVTLITIGICVLLSTNIRHDKPKMIGVGVSIIAPFLICISSLGSAYFVSNYSYEYWNGYGNQVTLREGYWQTYTSRDSKGRTTTTRVYYPPDYSITDLNGCTVGIDSSEYFRIGKLWGHKPMWNMDLGLTHSYKWKGEEATKIFVASKHAYKNKTQNQGSLYKYQKLTEDEKIGLFERHSLDSYQTSYLYGYNDFAINRRLLDLNCFWGHKKQIVVNILVFPTTDMEVAIKQERLWLGGHKNELNICYGVVDGNMVWCKVFSWSDAEGFKTGVQNFHEFGKPLDLNQTMSYLNRNIEENWVRKEFKDFNYIGFEYPVWSYIIVVVGNCIVIVGICVTKFLNQ